MQIEWTAYEQYIFQPPNNPQIKFIILKVSENLWMAGLYYILDSQNSLLGFFTNLSEAKEWCLDSWEMITSLENS